MNSNEKERTTFNFDNSMKKNNAEINLEKVKAITLASGFREKPKGNNSISFRRTRRKKVEQRNFQLDYVQVH